MCSHASYLLLYSLQNFQMWWATSLCVSSESVALRLHDCWMPFFCCRDHSPNRCTLAVLGLSARDPYSTILIFLTVVTEPSLLLQRDLIIYNSNERLGLAWWSCFFFLFPVSFFYAFTIDVCFCNLISAFPSWFSSESDQVCGHIHDAGLPGLANKNIVHPVKLEFQIDSRKVLV